ncbi:hypothetical protein ACYT85_20145 [Ralstonia solanacearum]
MNAVTAAISSSLAFERILLGLALGVPLLLVPGLRLKPRWRFGRQRRAGRHANLAISALIRTGGGF